MKVTLTNGALTYQDEKQGTYEESVTVNGKTSWISTGNNMAIWYVPQFKEWAIGSALQIGQRYTYRVLLTIQMKLILLCVWAELAILGSTKTALKFKYEI